MLVHSLLLFLPQLYLPDGFDRGIEVLGSHYIKGLLADKVMSMQMGAEIAQFLGSVSERYVEGLNAREKIYLGK